MTGMTAIFLVLCNATCLCLEDLTSPVSQYFRCMMLMLQNPALVKHGMMLQNSALVNAGF